MIKVPNVQIPLDYDYDIIVNAVAKTIKIHKNNIKNVKLLKRSTVNKNKENIFFKAIVGVTLLTSEDENNIAHIRKNKGVEICNSVDYFVPHSQLKNRPVIVGFGPAGIFAALILAESGARPIVLERGLDVDSRYKDILSFQNTGKLLGESNIQFGEGGAGAFSDGKLKTGLIDKRKNKILTEFISAGATENILYLEKPHIGSDRLRVVVKNLRKKIISLGGEVHFNSRVTKIIGSNNKVCGIGYEKDGVYEEISADNVILAIGHSARDTFEYLYDNGIKMQPKGFGVGVRIEHPQSLINELQYGKYKGHPRLGAADYKLVTHLKNGRSMYTFCMCPGGYVVGAASEQNRICTNGMSEYLRDGQNANTAMLISVTPSDFGSAHPLAGIEYQRKIESQAFACGGSNYCAPVQRLEDFMNKKQSNGFGDVKPTYLPGTKLCPVDEYLPKYITESLRLGFEDMFKWLPGYYYGDALLTGPETRTTSPIRMPRDESLQSESLKGLYPCGEGAGYAGGIISAAADGVMCAERIIGK